MRILLVVQMIILILLYMVSRGRYLRETALLEKDDRLRLLAPIGMQVTALFPRLEETRYAKKLAFKIKVLRGDKNTREHLRLHLGKKTAILLLAFVFITFAGTLVVLDAAFVFFGVLLPAVLFYAYDKQLDERIRERTRAMQLEFPEFLNKLVLLVNAGMTLHGAIQKIVREAKKGNPLYSELVVVLNEINTGSPEAQAFECFSRRCRLQEITMFVGTLLQNLRKGNDELVPILRLQAAVCWESRKNLARKLGEEASTRLLFPMMLMFVAILIMLMAPAVMQMQV
jgi:tight adherence protein C